MLTKDEIIKINKNAIAKYSSIIELGHDNDIKLLDDVETAINEYSGKYHYVNTYITLDLLFAERDHVYCLYLMNSFKFINKSVKQHYCIDNVSKTEQLSKISFDIRNSSAEMYSELLNEVLDKYLNVYSEALKRKETNEINKLVKEINKI